MTIKDKGPRALGESDSHADRADPIVPREAAIDAGDAALEAFSAELNTALELLARTGVTGSGERSIVRLDAIIDRRDRGARQRRAHRRAKRLTETSPESPEPAEDEQLQALLQKKQALSSTLARLAYLANAAPHRATVQMGGHQQRGDQPLAANDDAASGTECRGEAKAASMPPSPRE